MIKTADKDYVSYLRYESGEFDRDKISTDLSLEKVFDNKPDKAWWGSPIDANFGWKEWCEKNHEESVNLDNPIKWKFEDNCKIITLNYDELVLEKDNLLLEYIIIKRKIYSLGRLDIIVDATAEEKIDIIKKKSSLYHVECQLNYEKLLQDGIVGVEILYRPDKHTNKLERAFTSWLCESIIVLYDKKIVFEKENSGD